MIKFLLIASATLWNGNSYTPRVVGVFDSELECRTYITKKVIEESEWNTEQGIYGLGVVGISNTDEHEKTLFCVKNTLSTP